MQPRKKSHSVDEGTGGSGLKRRSVYSGKARLPGKKKPRTSNAEKSGGPQQPIDAITFGTDGATGLEQVVSSVAERMLPEINRKIETIISQRLDTSMNEGSKISSNPELSVLNEVICFDTIESPSCLSDPPSINSVHDDLAMHVPHLVKQKIMKGEFVELHTLLNKQADFDTQESRVLFMNGQLTLKPTNATKITSIDAWLDAFFIYMSIYLSSHVDQTLNIIKYMANVKLGASRVSGGLGWREYDRHFRLKRAKDNSISWGKIDQELWLLYITPNSNTQSVYKNTQNNPKFCYEYNNKGFCRVQNCQYQHQCLKCQYKHPAIHCSDKQVVQRLPASRAFQAPQPISSNFRRSGNKYQANPFRKNRFNSS